MAAATRKGELIGRLKMGFSARIAASIGHTGPRT
jgi:hypothetical protein